MTGTGAPMAPMPVRLLFTLGPGFGRAEFPPALERVASAFAVATALAEAHRSETGEADAEHRPSCGLGNRPERGHVAVDGEPERAETARSGDLDEVRPRLLKVPKRSERTDDRRQSWLRSSEQFPAIDKCRSAGLKVLVAA